MTNEYKASEDVEERRQLGGSAKGEASACRRGSICFLTACMPSNMPPQNTEADAMQVGALVGGVNAKNPAASGLTDEKGGAGGKTNGLGGGGRGAEEAASEGSLEGIPLKRWVMHGAVIRSSLRAAKEAAKSATDGMLSKDGSPPAPTT
ncbi:hypothetical protein EYF80_044439 [Liparis tanakae]|uniref:Uncharacterized protein n=1 Tax=Liparis tanakae TaxID=230148 RepID=A0A4Z2FX89_9TELE|nr:hypothetical protein EYF80_044439 [Liparis tanakae]